jgi:phage terminase Nu1 subunit (DNA packaging protein)
MMGEPMLDMGDAPAALTAEEEAALVAAWPLPEGVPDAQVNKAQLATALNVSETTVSAWLRAGLPYVEAGTNGRSYVFRLAVAYAWVTARRAEEERSRSAADAAAAQLQLALLGGETAGSAPDKLSLADQRKLLELELVRTQAARGRGELIPRADVVEGLEAVFAALRDALDALPDRLGRELGASGRDLERIEAACDDALAGATRAVGALARELEE